jgi:hypothetical protein
LQIRIQMNFYSNPDGQCPKEYLPIITVVKRAKSVSAKHYALYKLDKMTEAYKEAWQRFGVNIDDRQLI